MELQRLRGTGSRPRTMGAEPEAAGVAVRATRSFTDAELCEMDVPGSTTRSLIWMWLALMASALLTKPSIVVAKAYVPSERYDAS